ncbi:MAG: dihydroorotase [Pseudomonadota bacterium]
MVDHLKIVQPDDWHLHLRDGEVLTDTVYHTSLRFARAIVMPNLQMPITTTSQALDYRNRILENTPSEHNFNPLMTLYLTDNTAVSEIIKASTSEFIKGVKLYPAGATTNSDAGVTDIKHCYDVFEVMQKNQLPLLIHGEVTSSNIDVFDREKVFIEQVLIPLHNDFPELKIVFEHITTQDAVDFILQSDKHLAATITVHHLLMNRNNMLVGGIKPHYYCLPILKKNIHQQALIDAATSGSNKFFLGTDSAPHTQQNKESSCGCAGMFTSHAAIELYAEVFDHANALGQLEKFASFNGPDFYHLARNNKTIKLIRQDWKVPEFYKFGKDHVIPLRAGEIIHWKLDGSRK